MNHGQTFSNSMNNISKNGVYKVSCISYENTNRFYILSTYLPKNCKKKREIGIGKYSKIMGVGKVRFPVYKQQWGTINRYLKTAQVITFSSADET